VNTVGHIDYNFSRFKFSSLDQGTTILRLPEFDHRASAFPNNHLHPVVVNIGCRLDTRFKRVDNGSVQRSDLDLPEVIEFRSKLFPETSRCQMLGYSVFDKTWLDLLGDQTGQSFLFMAEGVFPYFTEEQVKGIFLLLRDRYPGCELVCDGMTPAMINMHNLQFVFSRL
jgi:O-methyltransferase involved in polyketide biosynthesis